MGWTYFDGCFGKAFKNVFMKTYELKVRFTIKEDENDEWFDFKKDILNGAFQRSMMEENTIGMTKITATITEIKK